MNPLVAEKKDSLPILIVDKQGLIGPSLTEKLSADTQIVFVSQKEKTGALFGATKRTVTGMGEDSL